jgi:hypothetical protein
VPTQRFSETTFAFAATQEISRLDPWWSSHTPIFPSLRRERRGGYDVRFDLPATFLLLQYKLSKEVSHLRLVKKPRGSAALLRSLRSECGDGLHQFWTTSHQHHLLDRVARRFPYTYYVAPRFADVSDLHGHLGSRTIMANSIIVKLSDFPRAKRGTSARHRIISPLSSWRNYVFSKPVALPRTNLRAELRDIWHGWIDEVPLSLKVRKIWEGLPRIGKSRALKWAHDEFVAARERFIPAFEEVSPQREVGRYLAPPIDSDARPPRPRRPLQPPWPTHLFRQERRREIVKYQDEDAIQLLALSRVLALAGLTMSVLQPSETALRNTEFYDDET